MKDDEILEELKRIRTLLEPKPAPSAPPPKKGLWNEFMDFLSKYRVMGLAVAFIVLKIYSSKSTARMRNGHDPYAV